MVLEYQLNLLLFAFPVRWRLDIFIEIPHEEISQQFAGALQLLFLLGRQVRHRTF